MNSASVIDCKSFTDSTTDSVGPVFSSSFGFSIASCNVQNPVLCCN
jgi:hypothetical protein